MKGRWIGFSAILLVYGLINFYIGWQFSLFLREAAPSYPRTAFWAVFGVIAFSYLLGRIPAPRPLRPAFRLLKVIGSWYFAVMEFALILILLADLIALALRWSGADTPQYAETAGWVVIGLLALLLLLGSRNAWSPIVREYPVQVDKRVPGMHKLRIAAASDLHLGNVVGKRHLKRLIARMNAMEPDLILLAGDVLDDSIEPFVRNRLGEWLGQLKAKYGVYAVLGNHEYYGGHIEEYVERMREIGIPVLRDERVEVEGKFIVAGRKDKTAEAMDPEGRVSVSQLLEAADRSKPILLMDHQPQQFAKAAEAGADLLLCGHTHRGQFAPNHWLTRRLFELDWGYMRKGAMHVAVSSGFGTWGPPIRLASRSEILLIDMALAESSANGQGGTAE
ncbi:metallophosphoesterase [Cohnella caldifontis]|uniref:metallophosphoesterase n=1 Tax=Cohnella caldifontis TaxID=3027471 RepID=UPI0023EDECD5|nr:metallophosphoesterase [Cohnella sp. YIM B05605]